MADSGMGKASIQGSSIQGLEPIFEGPCSLVLKAIYRARSHLCWMAVTTISLWGAVAVGVVFLAWGFFTYFYPMFFSAATQEGRSASLREALRLLPQFTLWAVAIWAVLLALAAVCTVAFIMVSRQATLHQIQMRLKELSNSSTG